MRQITLQTSAILSLLTSAAALSSNNNNRINRLPSTKRESRSQATVADASDVFSEQISLTSSRPKATRAGRQKKKAIRSPLVDSDLLRFLGTQKKLNQNLTNTLSNDQAESESSCLSDSDLCSRVALSASYAYGAGSPGLGMSLPKKEDERRSSPSIDAVNFWLNQSIPVPAEANILASNTASTDVVNSMEYDDVESTSDVRISATNSGAPLIKSTAAFVRPLVVDEIGVPESGGTAPFTSNTGATTATMGDVTDFYLGQFNSHRVASVLRSKDEQLDEALATKAGEEVQSQVLSRIARRRVRAFLKERDREWGVSRPSLSSTRSSVDYSIEDTLSVFYSFGLTAKDVAEILIHTPGLALMRPYPEEDSNGESLLETMDRAFNQLLCGTLKLRKYDARKVLRNSPGLLTMRGSKSAEQVVLVLSRLGVTKNSIARDKSALPALLSRSPAGIFRLVAFLGSDAVRMPVSKIGPLLRRPISEELLDVVVPVPRLNRGEDDGSASDVLDDDMSGPGALTALWGRNSQSRRDRINDVYSKMSNTAWTLRNEIGTADLSKVIAAYPSVLLLDAERQILPAAKYLMNELGIWEDDLPKVLQLYPALLGIEISQMEGVASYLISLGVDPDNLGSIFRSFPALLTLDVDNDMEPVVEFLRTIGIANVGRFISRLPPVLGYSVDRELKPKWEFVNTIFVDARFEVTRFPAYFSYPFERVIKTRFEYLQEAKRIPVPLVALDQVLRYGDKDFAVKVAFDKDEGAAFKKFAEMRKASLSSGGRGPRKQKK